MTLAKAHTTPIRFIKGGVLHTLHDVPPDRTLLDVLREDLHHTGTKEGCGDGNCGSCTVKLGDRIVTSCLVLGVEAEGETITTVEGLPNYDRFAVIEAALTRRAAVRRTSARADFCCPPALYRPRRP